MLAIEAGRTILAGRAGSDRLRRSPWPGDRGHRRSASSPTSISFWIVRRVNAALPPPTVFSASGGFWSLGSMQLVSDTTPWLPKTSIDVRSKRCGGRGGSPPAASSAPRPAAFQGFSSRVADLVSGQFEDDFAGVRSAQVDLQVDVVVLARQPGQRVVARLERQRAQSIFFSPQLSISRIG